MSLGHDNGKRRHLDNDQDSERVPLGELHRNVKRRYMGKDQGDKRVPLGTLCGNVKRHYLDKDRGCEKKSKRANTNEAGAVEKKKRKSSQNM